MSNFKQKKELDDLAKKFIKLRDKTNKTNDPKIKKEFVVFQNFCLTKFSYLITQKVRKYKKFNNYADLEQEGYEGLLMALKSYKNGKSSFVFWANYYISTRISRAANSHSVIKFPLDVAKKQKPSKVAVPIILDDRLPSDNIEIEQKNQEINEAILTLPEIQQQVLKATFGFATKKNGSMQNAMDELKLSRNKCYEILEEAKNKLRNELLTNYYDGMDK